MNLSKYLKHVHKGLQKNSKALVKKNVLFKNYGINRADNDSHRQKYFDKTSIFLLTFFSKSSRGFPKDCNFRDISKFL